MPAGIFARKAGSRFECLDSYRQNSAKKWRCAPAGTSGNKDYDNEGGDAATQENPAACAIIQKGGKHNDRRRKLNAFYCRMASSMERLGVLFLCNNRPIDVEQPLVHAHLLLKEKTNELFQNRERNDDAV